MRLPRRGAERAGGSWGISAQVISRRVGLSSGPQSYSLEGGCDTPARGPGRSPPGCSPVRDLGPGASPGPLQSGWTPYSCSQFSSYEKNV